MLQENPELFQLYKDLVVTGVITADEFWASRVNDSSLFFSSIKQSHKLSSASKVLAYITSLFVSCLIIVLEESEYCQNRQVTECGSVSRFPGMNLDKLERYLFSDYLISKKQILCIHFIVSVQI